MPVVHLRALSLAIFACCANQVAEARSLWTVDPAQTRVSFVIDAVGWPRTGRFTNFQGKIAIDFDNPHASKVSFKVEANSVDAGSSSLNDFLRGEPFFNVANYPYISFVSTSVEKADERHAHVTGSLTMLGVTRPINLNVEFDRKLAGAGQRVGFKATGTINRRDFGMNSGYPAIGEAVHLIVTTKLLASHDPSSAGISRDAQSFAQPRRDSSRAEGIGQIPRGAGAADGQKKRFLGVAGGLAAAE